MSSVKYLTKKNLSCIFELSLGLLSRQEVYEYFGPNLKRSCKIIYALTKIAASFFCRLINVKLCDIWLRTELYISNIYLMIGNNNVLFVFKNQSTTFLATCYIIQSFNTNRQIPMDFMQCFKSIFKGHFQTEFEVFLFNGLKIQTFLETLGKSRFFFVQLLIFVFFFEKFSYQRNFFLFNLAFSHKILKFFTFANYQ